MAIPAINVLGNPNVTEGNFQIAIEDLRKSVIGSGKAYDSANTYSQYDTCVYGGIIYYSKINSNTGNTPAINANWGLIGDLFNLLINNGTAFGYGTGSGGSVNQLTDKNTDVTINRPCGHINLSNSSLSANGYAIFQVFNNTFGGYDSVDVQIAGGTLNGQYYRIGTTSYANGVFRIFIKNEYTAALAEGVIIKYTIIKGAIA